MPGMTIEQLKTILEPCDSDNNEEILVKIGDGHYKIGKITQNKNHIVFPKEFDNKANKNVLIIGIGNKTDYTKINQEMSQEDKLDQIVT